MADDSMMLNAHKHPLSTDQRHTHISHTLSPYVYRSIPGLHVDYVSRAACAGVVPCMI